MTPVSHEQSLAAEDEGGGSAYLETNDMRRKSPVKEQEEDPEETEDEEVKVNCINGVLHSEMSSDEESDEDDDDVEDADGIDDMKQESRRPVHFVSSSPGRNVLIQRPRAILANSPSRSPQDEGAEEDDVDADDDSSMDESSDDDASSVEEHNQGIGMSMEATNLYQSDTEDSLSEASSAGGIAGSDSERDGSDEEEEEEEQDDDLDDDDDESTTEDEDIEEEVVEDAQESQDEEMSDEESTASVPFDTFNNVDDPSDELELESALQDTPSKMRNADEDAESVASDDSAMEDLQDPTLQSALLCDIVELEPKKENPDALAHVKRVLSSSALLGRSSSSTMLSPKRICRQAGSDCSDEDALPPELSLGPTAFCTSQKVSVTDEDDEEQDRQLGEELREGEEERERVTTPIPLLTPPGSPLRVESDDGNGDVTVCEWPSNLAVDSALAATKELRPPSPQNLQTWELEEEERLMKSAESSPKAPPGEDAFSSSLTPMMRGISVEPDAPVLRL